MQPYALKLIPPDDLGLFHSIRKAIENLPDFKELPRDASGKPMELSCHMLARAVKKNFRCVSVRDGHYDGVFNHSWIVTPNKNVIDVYPVGSVGGPVMLACSVSLSPGRRLFKSKPGCFKEEFERKEFLKAVDIVSRTMAQRMAQLGI